MYKAFVTGWVVALLAGCGGGDGGPGTVPDSPDAAPPPPPTYPQGPYGTKNNDIIADLQFRGFVDSSDNGALVYDETSMQEFSLASYYSGFDPEARIIVVNTAAGWCPPCQDEARDMARLNTKYFPQGVRIVTALFQTDSGAPATEKFVNDWARIFQITVPCMVDADFILEDYLDLNAMPTNIFINAHTMKIISVLAGNGGATAFDNILDYYLAHEQ